MSDPTSDTAGGDAVAVISDVHGNLPALQAVLGAIESLGVGEVWCLGDTVGYGPFARECVREVAAHCEIVLAGNHEVVLRRIREQGNPFGGGAGAGIDHAAATLDAAGWEFVEKLPTHHLTPTVELYHAASVDPIWQYVITSQDARQHLAAQRAPLSLVGHSHRQLLFARSLDQDPRDLPEGGATVGGQVHALDGLVAVANPGSVGQPRDGDPRAAFAVVEGGSITFHRIEYDLEAMESACRQAGLPANTWERLREGR